MNRNIKSFRYSLTLLGVSLMTILSFGQEKQFFIGNGESKLVRLEQAGAEAFKKNDFFSAFKFYNDAARIDDSRLEYHYRMAEAARNYGAYCIASEVYGKVVERDTAQVFPQAAVYFGEMEKIRGDYYRADSILMEIQQVSADNATTTSIEKNVRDIEFIETFRNSGFSQDDYRITKLDSTVNTPYTELSPVWWNDQLYYGSLAFNKSKDEVRPRRKFTKTLLTNLNTPPTAWDDFNVKDQSTTHLSFTPEGNRVYFTICDYNEQNKIVCQIYYRDKISDQNWSNPRRLPQYVNHPFYTQTQPAVGRNANGQEVLYFASDRPEGEGGLDLWYIEIMGKDSFSLPVNLGTTINTEDNEISPFYQFDKDILYFSSDGLPGFGGYDIYKTKALDMDNWEEPTNMYPPFNSGYNDFDYFLKDSRKEAFLVSNRDGCDPEVGLEAGCHDIYLLEMPPCTTDMKVLLFDEDTREPLSGGEISRQVGDMNFVLFSSKVNGHEFVFSDLDWWGEHTLMAEKEGYVPKMSAIDIKECDTNEFRIYLKKICEPVLTVSVFEKDGINDDLPVTGAVVSLSAPDAPNEKSQSGDSHLYEFSVDRGKNYTLKVFSVNHRLHTQTYTTSEGCENELTVLLERENPEFDTIACYFDHDIPKRQYRNGVEIMNEAYNEFYQAYMQRRGRYVQRFTAGKSGQQRIDDEQDVHDFFSEKVDSSFAVLERFKDNLLQKLEELPEGEIYIVTIQGYTSNVGTTQYNLELAQRRITSVKNYFIKTYGAQFSKYLFEKQSLIFEDDVVGEDGTGFDDPKDYQNTIYNPVSAQKRRVEIIRKKQKSTSSDNGTESR